MDYLSFNGYKVKASFVVTRDELPLNARYISDGQICKKESIPDDAKWVQVYHVSGLGYGYINNQH